MRIIRSLIEQLYASPHWATDGIGCRLNLVIPNAPARNASFGS
jgi:hypothetical protein